jgi:hypothetical protein
MRKSEFHLSEAIHCRILAASITDLHVRTALSRMAKLLAVRAAKTEAGPSAID